MGSGHVRIAFLVAHVSVSLPLIISIGFSFSGRQIDLDRDHCIALHCMRYAPILAGDREFGIVALISVALSWWSSSPIREANKAEIDIVLSYLCAFVREENYILLTAGRRPAGEEATTYASQRALRPQNFPYCSQLVPLFTIS